MISTRGVAIKGRGLRLNELQNKLYKANRVKRSIVMRRAEDGGLIVPSDDATEGGQFEFAVRVSHSVRQSSEGWARVGKTDGAKVRLVPR
jgi:hypothetical protein